MESNLVESNVQLLKIIQFLDNKMGFDFSGYREPMLQRRIKKRLIATSCNSFADYLDFLENNEMESVFLIDVLTINVSHFFRNSLSFEYIKKKILPQIVSKQKENGSIRIWSAGCSYGEEPYSLAILMDELIEKEECNYDYVVYATDMDKKALEMAKKGRYSYESIHNVKYGLLKKYFTKKEETFWISPGIKKRINFSFYDLMNKSSTSPPESIYGAFDLVLCRNVLIYFNKQAQDLIFSKLYKSLNKEGYLVLGEAEAALEEYKLKLRKVSDCCNIYQKIG